MTDRIRDDEPDVSEIVVRKLLRAELPELADANLHYKLTATDRALRKFSDADLAAELQRRGWIVAEP